MSSKREVNWETDALDTNESRRQCDSDPYRPGAHAVIIGINDYEDPAILDLHYARSDAQGIYDVLTDPSLGRFNPEKVALLLDEEATRRNIVSAIATKLAREGNINTVCIFFAGHGAPDTDQRSDSKDGIEKYLVPHDGRANDLRATAINMASIDPMLSYIDAGQIIIYIDSCYSGATGGRTFSRNDVGIRATLSDEFLESLGNEGRVTTTACNVNEVSLEDPKLKHGLFTHFLIEGMKGAADRDKDGKVSVDELYSYVSENVSSSARKLRGRMTPVRKGSVTGDVYLTEYDRKSPKTKEDERPDKGTITDTTEKTETNPSVYIKLSVSPQAIWEGAEAKWTVTLRNDGDEDLHHLTVAHGRALLDEPFDLAVNKGRRFTISQTYWDEGEQAERVTVSGIAESGRRVAEEAELAVRVMGSREKARVCYETGQSHYQAEDYSAAIESHSEAIRLQPDYAGAFNCRGMAYNRLGDYSAAIDDYSEAIRLRPDFADALHNRGISLADNGDHAAAIDDYTESMRLYPEQADSYRNRGLSYAALQDFAAAIDDYADAIRIQPDDADAFNSRGIAYNALGDYRAAIDDYSEAIQLRPDFADALHNRGISLAAVGDHAAAIDDYTESLRLHPEQADSYRSRGWSYAALRDHAAAIDDYTEAIRLDPMFIETYFKRGCANAELGKHVLAVMDFDETIRLNPDHEAAIERRRHSLAILDPKENRHPATTELSTEAVSAATDGESTNQWLWGTGLGAVVGWVALGNAPGMMIWGPIVGAMIGSFVGLLVVVWRH